MSRRPPRTREIKVRPRKGTAAFDAWALQRSEQLVSRSTTRLDKLIGDILAARRLYDYWLARGKRPSDPAMRAIRNHIEKYVGVAEVGMKRIQRVARGRTKK